MLRAALDLVRTAALVLIALTLVALAGDRPGGAAGDRYPSSMEYAPSAGDRWRCTFR